MCASVCLEVLGCQYAEVCAFERGVHTGYKWRPLGCQEGVDILNPGLFAFYRPARISKTLPATEQHRTKRRRRTSRGEGGLSRGAGGKSE